MHFRIDDIRQWAEGVWADLKEANLAGVAIGLAVLLLAVTVMAVRSGGPLEIKSSAPAKAAEPEDVSFQLPGEETLTIKDIDVSNPRNPFQSLASLAAGGGGGVSGGGDTHDQASAEDTVTAMSSPAAGTTTAQLQPIEDVRSAPTYPVDDEPGTTDDVEHDPAGNFDDEEEPADAPATDYSYTADVQFGLVDTSLKRYREVQRLSFVPSRANPMLMYLGAKPNHETAVFMVDSRLSQGGEGTCVPRDSLCTFIEMSLDPSHDEHRFRDEDGNEYLLRLLDLERSTTAHGSLSGSSLPVLSGTPDVIDGTR